MSSEMRGWLRRYALYHTAAWIILAIVMLGFFSDRPNWHRFWALLLPFVVPLLVLPNFLRFRRLGRALGLSRGSILARYLLGTPAEELEAAIREQAARTTAWQQLFQVVAAEAPELAEHCARLQQVDDLRAAYGALDRARAARQRNERTRQLKMDGYRAEAAKLHCSGLAEPLIVAGGFKAVDGLFDEVRRLLARAKQLGLEAEATSLIAAMSTADFSGVQQLIKSAEDVRATQRLAAAYEARIAELPAKLQPKLRRLLSQLVDLPWGSRDFRKHEHELEYELGQAVSADL